jgi:lipid II:glycine glycyltransferase (peptidoglycan interpeptide bridge formation enzyme)
MLKIKTIRSKSQWEQYLQTQSEANFLQSYNWGLFSQRLNKKFFPLGLFDNEQQIGAAMVIKEKAKRGDYLTVAAGPILNWKAREAQQIFQQLCHYLKNLAKKEGCHFVRIRPQALDTPRLCQIFQNCGLQPAPMHLTADLTLQLKLDQSDQELLTQMRKNTRYYIRRAKRDGIRTEIIQDPDFMQTFYKYQLYLADKHNFVPFAYDFLLQQFKVFVADDQVAFVNSYYQDQLLASAFIIFYNSEAVYHYGVSTPANDKWPGSYATQWAAIQEAKKRKCKVYNFWGIAPQDRPDHRFAGVSLFKRGFGGEEVAYLPAHDLPVSLWYGIEQKFEFIRKKMRGL